MDEDMKKYLHELVDMTTHHLVRRYAGNLLHFPRSKKVMGTIHSCLSISPDTGTDLLLLLASHLLLLKRTTYLLDLDAWRGLLTVL